MKFNFFKKCWSVSLFTCAFRLICKMNLGVDSSMFFFHKKGCHGNQGSDTGERLSMIPMTMDLRKVLQYKILQFHDFMLGMKWINEFLSRKINKMIKSVTMAT